MNAEQLMQKNQALRISILKMLATAKSGHPGGSLSAIDIISVLYHQVLKHDPKKPQWPERDRFILSKGHVCPAHYAVLADQGYFDPVALDTLRQYGSILQGHPSMHHTPGVEVSGGSLGQGLSIAVGMALGAKISHEAFRVYCMMGDGELQEGQIWEAAMAAGYYKLDGLCGIVDFNRMQIDGFTEDVMSVNPIRDKWIAFNWHVIEIDGHDLTAIENAFYQASAYKGKPTVIIAKTIKGKGVSFMENNAAWHGTAPNSEELAKALTELAC
ncbi:transketolase [Fusibacter paucivorans]|uniref:Transketolase n=1 Tax=Fusibacter paucivorans TaxID=76009 RepID=A0ABS5PMG5_9FIRM|nr:transketolase [Fusibacter paucivorans]MBS7526373.1 transketolase [Fusibacter paucivorans]